MLPSVTIDSNVSVAHKGKQSISKRRRSKNLKSIQLGKVKGVAARKNWDRLVKKITLYLTVLDIWQHTKGPITYSIVKTEAAVRTLFGKIDDFLVPKKRQNKYMVLMGFMGQEISRDGEVTQVAFTLPDGMTWIVDLSTVALAKMFWPTAKEFLSNPNIEKVVFDGKHIADYLYHVHDIELRGVYDLLVIEAMERGRIETVETLPTVEGRGKEVDRQLFLDMVLISQCYLAETFSCLEKNISEEEWELGILAASMPQERSVNWIVDYQRFMLQFYNMINFVGAFKNRKYIKWFVSSTRYSTLLAEKAERSYDETENNPLIPNYILSFKGTDQPLGICRCIRCQRALPTKDYSVDMMCNLKPKTCITCLKIINHVIKRTEDGKVEKTKVDLKKLEDMASQKAFKRHDTTRRSISSRRQSIKKVRNKDIQRLKRKKSDGA